MFQPPAERAHGLAGGQLNAPHESERGNLDALPKAVLDSENEIRLGFAGRGNAAVIHDGFRISALQALAILGRNGVFAMLFGPAHLRFRFWQTGRLIHC